MMHNLRGSVAAALIAGMLSVATAAAQPPESCVVSVALAVMWRLSAETKP
jgi:hypothetical protein